MSDQYLWDCSGPPDPEVVALEKLLAPLGQRQPPPALALPVSMDRRRLAPWAIITLATAATLMLAVSVLWLRPASRPGLVSWHVLDTPGRSTLSVGESLRTGSTSHTSIELGEVGHVDLGPSTVVRLIATRAGHYRLRLEQGTLTALIWAAPGQFFVETRSSLAVDLGCAYTLQVDEHGSGTLRVTAGWVGFQLRDRQALIPEGAVCATRSGVGPGTPHYEDAPAAIGAALQTLDFGPDDPRARAAALDRVLAAVRPRDAFTLWHLLQRLDLDRDQRGRVYDRLAQLVPAPPAVTRDGVVSGNRHMLELWWDRLGLGSADFWRAFARPWNEPAR